MRVTAHQVLQELGKPHLETQLSSLTLGRPREPGRLGGLTEMGVFAVPGS